MSSNLPGKTDRLGRPQFIIGTLSNDNGDGDGNVNRIREKSKGALRMTSGKHVDVLRSGPTLVELISRCQKT